MQRQLEVDKMIRSSHHIYPFTKESERLILRPLTTQDTGDWIHFMSDPLALKHFTIFDPRNASETAPAWIEKQLKRYEDGEYGMLAIIEKSSGSFVGQCGLLTQEVDGIRELEIGYSFLSKHWGKGYATEAAQFLKEFAFEHQLNSSVISQIHPDNVASQKVAIRNGMVAGKKTVWRGLPIVVYRINNPNSDL
ncbi:MAG: GNAT family N-acetyltransferase [Flavobacteriales bacterium]|nr:GNAT family N-acetyltransferase [Flavobacteriales bacterium]